MPLMLVSFPAMFLNVDSKGVEAWSTSSSVEPIRIDSCSALSAIGTGSDVGQELQRIVRPLADLSGPTKSQLSKLSFGSDEVSSLQESLLSASERYFS